MFRMKTYKKQRGEGRACFLQSIVELPLSFHTFTNIPFSNCFVLTFMHQMGGCTPPFSRFPCSQSLLLAGAAPPPLFVFNFQLSTFNLLLLAIHRPAPISSGSSVTSH